jgi:mRNA interferase HigB
MHVVSHKKIKEFIKNHPDSQSSLDAWFDIAEEARWTNPHDVRDVFPHADRVGSCVVFNISGHKYRLIARIFYADPADPDGKPTFNGRVYIRFIMTHAEYDEEKWKADCDC